MKSFSNPGFGLLLLRLTVGGLFLYHGITKFQNMQGTIGFFASLGFPAFLAYLVAAVETVGGILMVLGLWTSVAGAALAIILAVAIFKTKLGGAFPKAELDVLLLVASLSVAFGGAGSCSLLRCFKRCDHKCDHSCGVSAPAASSAPAQNPPSARI